MNKYIASCAAALFVVSAQAAEVEYAIELEHQLCGREVHGP